jgi:UDP-galactopyranose mutase
MWGEKWEDLPKHITNRVPKIRESDNNAYHLDPYQGLPKHGYTRWIENMFDGCKVHLNSDPEAWRGRPGIVIYTGSLDAYYGYDMGVLPYRSLSFITQITARTPYNQLNYCSLGGPTRTIDHSHWYKERINGLDEQTVLTHEYPEEFELGKNERFYPKRYGDGLELYKAYKERTWGENTIFLGRLGTYSYLDMDDCISQVFAKLKDI